MLATDRTVLASSTKVFIVVVLAAAVVVAILLPLLKVQSLDAADLAYKNLDSTGALWAEKLQYRMSAVIGVATAARGFVEASFKVLPNISAPALERIAGQHIPRFDNYSQLYLASNPYMQIMQLVCGGVISQTVPPNISIGVDVLTTGFARNILPTVSTGRNFFGGPFMTLQRIVAIVVLMPVYNHSMPLTTPDERWAAYWGHITLFADPAILLQSLGMHESLQSQGLQWVLIVNSTRFLIGIGNTTLCQQQIMETGRAFDISFAAYGWNHEGWVLYLYTPKPETVAPQFIAAVVLCALGGALAVIVLYFGIRKVLTMQTRGAPPPPDVPCAYCLLSIAHTEDLWTAVGNDAVYVFHAVEQQVAVEAHAHGGYVSKSLAQHCFTVACPTVHDALALSLAVMDWCNQPRHFSPEIAALLAMNHMKVECAASVSTLSDSAATRSVLQGTLVAYEGPEVLAAVKLSRRTRVNAVLLAEAAMALLTPAQLEGLTVEKVTLKTQSATQKATRASPLQATPTAGPMLYFVSRGAKLDTNSGGSTSTNNQRSMSRRLRTAVLEELLRPQAAVSDIGESEGLLDVAYIFLETFKTMFRPLAQQEMASIERHVEQAFGAKKSHHMLENLALACMLRHTRVCDPRDEELRSQATSEEETAEYATGDERSAPAHLSGDESDH